MWPRGHLTDLRNDLKSNRKPKPNVFRGVRLGVSAKCLELCCGKWIEQDKMGPRPQTHGGCRGGAGEKP